MGPDCASHCRIDSVFVRLLRVAQGDARIRLVQKALAACTAAVCGSGRLDSGAVPCAVQGLETGER